MLKRMNLNVDLETELTADEFAKLFTEFMDAHYIPFNGGITENTGEYAVSESDETESYEDHQAILDTV